MLRGMFASVMADEFFTIPTKEAKECLQAAKEMMQKFTEVTGLHRQFSDWLVCCLKKIVADACKRGINREKLWSSFHQKTSSEEFTTKWENFALQLGVRVSPLFYQHITDEIFNELIKNTFEVQTRTNILEKTTLSFEEENVVHYVGGYVLHSLMKDPGNSGILPLLEKLCCNEDSAYVGTHVGTSCQWTKSLDRGGLTHITDEAFQCFYEIEVVCRQYLRADRTREMTTGFTKTLTTAILNDDDLLFSWCLAVGADTSDDIANQCLPQIVKKWIAIRGNSFARNMLEMYKQFSKKGTDKSKPLRSKLFTDNM